MSKAILFLHTFEDVKNAAHSLGFPIDLVAHDCRVEVAPVRVNLDDELESAFQQVRNSSSSHELAVIRV